MLCGEARCRDITQFSLPKLSNKFNPENFPQLESKVLGWIFVLNGQIHNQLFDINK
jgi:hypothetical protein